MPGCSALLAASMTGSTEVGPIQPPKDSAPMLDEDLFVDGGPKTAGRYLARQDPRPARRGLPVQLTPLWEYVVRTRKFPKDVDAIRVFDEISERLRDPEWEVRQHALRVLVDVLPTFDTEVIDELASIVLADLIDNLGNSAPAVRKGSLDAIRIYLLHTPSRDGITKKILRDGMNRADVLDDYQTSVATGVILSTPLLLFPSKSSARPTSDVVREATQALAMRLVQVTHQESALRSLAKIREAIGDEEFYGYLHQVDDSMKRNFDLLCDVYGVTKTSPNRKKRPKARDIKPRRRDSLEDTIQDVAILDKSWESEDSDTSGIVEEDNDGSRLSSGSVSSARVVLETEIKFNEETAITMTILEEQEKDADGAIEDLEDSEDDDDKEEIEASEERRKTPRRVHFGGEIVKLRTPDSEDAESVISDMHQQQLVQQGRTRIPLPVSPATRLPPQQSRRVRSSSQPGSTPKERQRQRRSSSISPKREVYHHNANLSPKKSILTKGSDFGERKSSPADRIFDIQKPPAKAHTSRRDSIIPLSSPKVIIQEVDEPKSFRVYQNLNLNNSSKQDAIAKSPSPTLLGDICIIGNDRPRDIDSIFGDRSGVNFQEKLQKDHENLMRSVYRSKSAGDKNEDLSDDDLGSPGKERRRSQSAKNPGFEAFPRQERNYILMELSSPVKETTRKAFLEDGSAISDNGKPSESPKINGQSEKKETQVDNKKIVASEMIEDEIMEVTCENGEEVQLGIIEEDLEKSALDARERSSDSSSDSEWRNKEPSWEELGLVDDEVLKDFHNKDDWRAKVRGLERMASALRAPTALETVEPRLGSLLHAVLGGERSCRVAAAGLTVTRVVLSGVSEDALKERLSLITWGLARQGGANAAQLARLTMLRTSPDLFLEKLLQPQCIGARNAKMRENTLQLLIFSLVTFPSTEFKVKSAIDKVVGMVGDRRKRVRHSALDTLAVLSQMYDSDDILEASKRFTKGKQDGQMIQAAIKTRLARKLLPTVSVDGLVVYGLQISSNSPYTGPDVEWIAAGSGSVSPGTGRTRGQLIAMSKMETNAHEQSNGIKKKVRPASEHSILNGNGGILEKDERTSSWKLLPQSEQNDKQNPKNINRASKSADSTKVNNTEIEFHKEEQFKTDSKGQKPYATPKRTERRINDTKSQNIKKVDESSGKVRGSNSASILDRGVPRLESRIPIYTGDRNLGSKFHNAEMEGDTRNNSPYHVATRKDLHVDNNGYLSVQQRRKLQLAKSAVPHTNHSINNYESSNNHNYSHYEKNYNVEQTRFRDDYRHTPQRGFKDYNNRALSYEKLNKSFDTTIKNSRENLRNAPYSQYSAKASESYESINHRHRRHSREEQDIRLFEQTTGDHYYDREYESHHTSRRILEHNKIGNQRNSNTKRIFHSPFDDHRKSQNSSDILDKETTEHETYSTPEFNRADSIRTLSVSKSTSLSDRSSSPRHDTEEARSNSGSSVSSNRSATNSHRIRSRQNLPAHTENEESNDRVRHDDKAFDVISGKGSRTRRDTLEAVSIRTEVEDDLGSSGSDGKTRRSPGSDTSRSDDVGPNCSMESLIDGEIKGDDLPPPAYNGYDRSPGKYRPASRSSSERVYSTRGSSSGRSIDLNDVNYDGEERDVSEDDDVPYESLDFRNEPREPGGGTSVTTPVRSRASYEYDNDLRNTNHSNITLYSCNNVINSPKSSSPQRFVTSDPSALKDTDDSDETPPLPIGFDSVNQAESSDGTDEIDDVSVKPQPSRLPTPIDLPRRLCKVSPCKMRPQANCNRATSVPNRHYEKHTEKSSKAVQQCFLQLESKDWEVTLKGLRTLSQIAKNEPEQLDVCAPGLLARVLGKHVKNLRSQVARVACYAAGEVFAAHIRGIDQDLDEIAGPLLHRTADTNRFLREDCNIALDSMIEHFPPQRTITIIANRGAGHQNAIVHATTARLFYVIVSDIGPEHVMILPREVRDKLFATNAKLLTDGNLQARKHAKETFRLLFRCDGFRKALNDAVPESTMRLIDKTLRSL